MSESQEINRMLQSNVVDANIIQIRLDTDAPLAKIEDFLRGHTASLEKDIDTGQWRTIKKTTGLAKANDIGIQSILSFMTTIVNPQTVQGNFTQERYDDYIEDVRSDLAEMIAENNYRWEIQDADQHSIINSVLNLVKPFISRLIGNKERDSYAQSLRVQESNTVATGKGSFI